MPTLSDDDSEEESDGIWQQVPENNNKRRLTESPNIHIHKKPNLSSEPSTSNANQFALLNDDDNDLNQTQEQKEERQPKPPPIYIPFVENINNMIKCISKVISNNEFNYKSMRDSQIRLMVKNTESYRKVVKHLDSKNICFHTYQLKQERAYRIVIKGIHHTTPVADIKADLLSLGYQVRNVFNIKSRVTKQPLSIFFVDLDPSTNNKDVYKIKHLSNAMVSIEPPKQTDDLVQCYRCQEFGHSKTYCKRPYKCVKCGNGHQTSTCTKDINTPPKCVHCLENHTASYKGCRIYQEIIHKKRNLNFRFRNQQNNQNQNFSQTNPTNNNGVHNKNHKNNTVLKIALLNILTFLYSKQCHDIFNVFQTPSTHTCGGLHPG